MEAYSERTPLISVWLRYPVMGSPSSNSTERLVASLILSAAAVTACGSVGSHSAGICPSVSGWSGVVPSPGGIISGAMAELPSPELEQPTSVAAKRDDQTNHRDIATCGRFGVKWCHGTALHVYPMDIGVLALPWHTLSGLLKRQIANKGIITHRLFAALMRRVGLTLNFGERHFFTSPLSRNMRQVASCGRFLKASRASGLARASRLRTASP